MKSWQDLKDKYPNQLSNCNILLPLGWYEVVELLVLDNLNCEFDLITRELPPLIQSSFIDPCTLHASFVKHYKMIGSDNTIKHSSEKFLNITCEECGAPGSNLIKSKTLFWLSRKTPYSHNFCDKCLIDYNNIVKLNQL